LIGSKEELYLKPLFTKGEQGTRVVAFY